MTFKTRLIAQRFRITTDQFIPAWKTLVANEQEEKPQTLIEALDSIGLKAEVDVDGNVKGVKWNTDLNAYHLEEFLQEIAPFVKAKSYLKFLDEFGGLTLYRFDGGQIKIKETNLQAEEEDEEENI